MSLPPFHSSQGGYCCFPPCEVLKQPGSGASRMGVDILSAPVPEKAHMTFALASAVGHHYTHRVTECWLENS